MTLHRQRGQALLETVAFIPMMLVTFFGLLYIMHLGVIFVRAQKAAQVASAMQLNSQPFQSNSAYAMITSLVDSNTLSRDVSKNAANCNSTAPTLAKMAFTQSNGVFDPSQSHGKVNFWQPTQSAVYTGCSTGVMLNSAIGGVTPLGIHVQQVTVSAQARNNDFSFLGGGYHLMNPTGFNAKATVLQPLTVAESVHCYSDLVDAIGRSIKLHNVYNTGGFGYGSYVDDAGPLLRLATYGISPLPYAEVSWMKTVDPGCTHVDHSMVYANGNVEPVGLWGSRYFNNYANQHLGTPSQQPNGPPIPPNQGLYGNDYVVSYGTPDTLPGPKNLPLNGGPSDVPQLNAGL